MAAGTVGLLVVRLFWLLIRDLRHVGNAGGTLGVVAAGAAVGGGAYVEVLQVQFIDKVVIVLMQLKFPKSRVCTGSSSTECWTFQLCSERVPTVQTVQKTVLGVDVPVISSDKFPQSRGSNPRAPDSAHPQRVVNIPVVQQISVEIPQVQFLVFWEVVDMPVYVQRQVLSFWQNFHIFYVNVDSVPEAASIECHGSWKSEYYFYEQYWHSVHASVHELLEEFRIFHVKGTRRSTRGSHWKSGHYSYDLYGSVYGGQAV